MCIINKNVGFEELVCIKMSKGVFDSEVLVEKLEKLNNSQQSIESLSRWCISHRRSAKQIVETWEKMFMCSQREQSVSFLYLANDILQNSRRKGYEFVDEFWGILPSALKHVYENGEEYAQKTVARLVDIWEERRVFGSRGQGLKNAIFEKDHNPLATLNSRIPNPVKIVRRDSHSLRVKLAVGGFPEKILTAFHGVHDEHLDEEAALDKCSFAVTSVGKLEEAAQICSSQGSEEIALVDELQKWDNILRQCVEHLETIEGSRKVLVSELRAALGDQELRHEAVCNQLHVARDKLEMVNNLRQRLESSSVRGSPPTPIKHQSIGTTHIAEANSTNTQRTSIHSQRQVSQTALPRADEGKRAAVAAIAAKLAASSSSAQMLTSVLSSLVAEEAASKTGGLKTSGLPSIMPVLSQDHKRPKLEKPMLIHATSSEMRSSYNSTSQHQTAGSSAAHPSTGIQAPFPLLPPMPPTTQPTSQFVQSATSVMPFGFNSGSSFSQPPPPMMSMGLTRQPLQMPQHHQQQAGTAGYYRPPGIGFYGQNHQPTTPPVPRQ